MSSTVATTRPASDPRRPARPCRAPPSLCPASGQARGDGSGARLTALMPCPGPASVHLYRLLLQQGCCSRAAQPATISGAGPAWQHVPLAYLVQGWSRAARVRHACPATLRPVTQWPATPRPVLRPGPSGGPSPLAYPSHSPRLDHVPSMPAAARIQARRAKDAVRLQRGWVHVPTLTRTHTGHAENTPCPGAGPPATFRPSSLPAQQPAGP